jgi:hypothetical protein
VQKRVSSTQIRRFERDLAEPIASYLRGLGCEQVVHELRFFDRGIDVYGVRVSGRRTTTFAVELKLKKWTRALQQAAIYQLCSDFSYVAMPFSSVVALDLSIFRAAGVGLLFVRPDGSVGQMLEAKQSVETRKHYVDALSRATLEDSLYAV